MRDLQKAIRYLCGLVTSTFKIGTGGWFVSPSFPGLSSVFINK